MTARPSQRPRKDYSRGRLRANIKPRIRRASEAQEARRTFEAVVDQPWSRHASLWLDTLTVLAERDE